jgi:hypothetical protein
MLNYDVRLAAALSDSATERFLFDNTQGIAYIMRVS